MVIFQQIDLTCGFLIMGSQIKSELTVKSISLTVIEFEEENELVVFNNNILRNYSAESFFGNFNAQLSPFSASMSLHKLKIFHRSILLSVLIL